MTLSYEQLVGSIPAIITPFTSDASEVDFSSLEKVITYVMAGGSSGVVACGSTGEAVTLSDDEYVKVIAAAVAVIRNLGKGFCIAGIGTSSTARAVAMAEKLGSSIDGILLVAPPYNKPTQAGIVAHFEAVHKVARAPIIAYNVPGRTAVNILPKTVQQLVTQRLIVGLKESSGSIDQVTEIASLVGDQIAILSGEDALGYSTMALGGRGIITVTGNVIPDRIACMIDAALKGDWERSRKIQFETLPMTRAMFMETNPIPVKAAMALRGVINSPAVRLPLMAAQSETVSQLKKLLGL